MDKAILLKINREWTNDTLDHIMVAFSSLPLWMPVFIAVVLSVAIWGNFRARAYLVVLAFTLAITDGLVARSLKYVVNRPRPHQTEGGLLRRDLARGGIPQIAVFRPIEVKPSKPAGKPVEGRSFPSAHTMNVFAAATAAWLLFRGYWWLLYLPSSLVAYSRIYTGSHWPSDIVPSIFMGVALGYFVPNIVDRLWKRFGGRFAPRWHSRHPDLVSPMTGD